MKVNSLDVRYKTISNFNNAIEDLCRIYSGSRSYFSYDLTDEYIKLQYMGKTVYITYFNTIYGDKINEDEIKKNPLIFPKYDKIEYVCWLKDEIKEKIISEFDIDNGQ